jgi:putative hydrolase of HD superfamily
MHTDEQLDGVVDYFFEAGLLKRAKRTGWWIAGVKDPETIAEHSFRTALIGSVLAMMEGADAAKVSLMCLLHDTQETRVGDIPYIGRSYLRAASNEDVTADQVAGSPPAVRDGLQAAVGEFEHGESIEALIARDADKLECLFQALEYREQGVSTVQAWIDNMTNAVKTESARQVAARALTANSQRWQSRYQDKRSSS